MANEIIYKPTYRSSWALVVGINAYQHSSPLEYACQDAKAIKELLTTKLGFPNENVELLLDENASRSRIMCSFLRFAEDHIHRDDRIVFFFAGHGCTRTGHRGEVGYLVPQDGAAENLSTLIRWDDLTRNAELIAAKHLIFLMESCYGGLAVGRALPPGSSRFLKDMLQRYSRQVLTAGKADEVVADAGGPRQGHSIFTGHLLHALEGAAATPDGIISANAVMAHVYDRVAKDPNSLQSPHYGFIDGDGDFIFQAPTLDTLDKEPEMDEDILIQVPASTAVPNDTPEEQSFTARVKDYLSDSRYRIRLDDLVAAEVRTALENTREDLFPTLTATVTPEDFAERLRRYERATERLSDLTILLARWATPDQQAMLDRIVSRLADANELSSGNRVWLGLLWYPLTLLMYSGGVAALSARNYRSLATLLTTRLGARMSGREITEVVVVVIDGIDNVKPTNIFRTLPGHEKNYVPMSEYLFKVIQPRLEDLLFLGKSYEDLFDRFEIMQAMVYADLLSRETQRVRGPYGRFVWKHHGRGLRSPFDALVNEGKQQSSSWPPLDYGLFGGSIERFREIASAYREVISKLHWF